MSVDNRVSTYRENVNTRMMVVNKEITNIVSVIASTGSQALIEKLSELEQEKKGLSKSLRAIEAEVGISNISEKELKATFKKAQKMFKQGTLLTNKKIIENYVDKIIIYKDHIEILFNIGITNPHNSNDDCGDFNINELLTLKESRIQLQP